MRRLRGLTVALLAVGLLALVAAAPAPGGWEVVARRADTGTVVAREALPASGAFAVDYVHSAYKAPVRELFAAGPAPEFRLVAVDSPRAAVLDYYALEGTRATSGDWERLTPQRPLALRALPLVGTPVGQRTLVVDGIRRPLFDPREPARHLVLEVRRPGSLAGVVSWLRRP